MTQQLLMSQPIQIRTHRAAVIPEGTVEPGGHMTLTYQPGDSVLIVVPRGLGELAARAAQAGIAAYNADPTFLDPAANKEGPSPRRRPTSKQAALANWPRSGSQRARILEFMVHNDLARRYGVTREDLTTNLGMSGDTVRPRVLELIRGGWLIESEQTRPSRKGNDSVVLLASQKAVEFRP